MDDMVQRLLLAAGLTLAAGVASGQAPLNNGDFADGGNLGSLQGKDHSGDTAAPPTAGIVPPVPLKGDGPAISPALPEQLGENPGKVVLPNLASRRIDDLALPPDAVRGAALPLSLGWVPERPPP